MAIISNSTLVVLVYLLCWLYDYLVVKYLRIPGVEIVEPKGAELIYNRTTRVAVQDLVKVLACNGVNDTLIDHTEERTTSINA